MPSPLTVSAKVLCFRTVRPLRPCATSVPTDLLPQYLMNGLSNLDETYREYSLAPTDDLIRCWRSKVKVTPGRDKGIHVDRLGCRGTSSDFIYIYLYSPILVATHNE